MTTLTITLLTIIAGSSLVSMCAILYTGILIYRFVLSYKKHNHYYDQGI